MTNRPVRANRADTSVCWPPVSWSPLMTPFTEEAKQIQSSDKETVSQLFLLYGASILLAMKYQAELVEFYTDTGKPDYMVSIT